MSIGCTDLLISCQSIFSDRSPPLCTHKAKGREEQFWIFFFWLWFSLESAQVVALDRSPQQHTHSCLCSSHLLWQTGNPPKSYGLSNKKWFISLYSTYSLVFKGLLQTQHCAFSLTATQNIVGLTKNSHLTPLGTRRENEDLRPERDKYFVFPCGTS